MSNASRRASLGASRRALLLALPLVATSVATLAPCIAVAQSAAPEPTAASASALPADTAVRHGRLANGLRYYVRRNGKPEHRAELRLVVDAGSVFESDEERGFAHLLEHMAFNGTRGFAKQELVQYLESVGMRFGPDLNAYTSFDETVYQLTLPTDSADVLARGDSASPLARGMDILRDWAGDITLDSAEVVAERPVVLEEWRSGQGAESRLRDRQFPVLFRGSPYAVRLPIGDTAVVRSATTAGLRAFYERWYRPDLMAVVAVGDFDAAAVERMIAERFASLPTAPDASPRPVVAVPDHAETLVSIATDPEATSTTVSVVYKRAPTAVRTESDVRREIVASLHDAMLNARLAEIAQQPDAPFLGAGAGGGGFVREADAYSIGAAVADGGVSRGLDALLLEAARVERHGFTATELARAKADLLRGMERAHAERDKTPSAAFADDYVEAYLADEPVVATAELWALYQRLVPAVTLADVNEMAAANIGDENRVVLVTAPTGAAGALPDSAALLAAFDRVRGVEVAAYDDRVADAPLVPTPPTPGRITETRAHADAGVTAWTLSNGARVLVKPTRFKDDQVLLAGRSPGGHSLASDREFVSASLAGTVAALGGVGALDAVQLEKALAGKAVGASADVGELEEGVSGSAAPRDLATLFELVHLHFVAPREDSAAFRSFVQRARASLENRGRSPEAAFADTLAVTLAGHHPRSRPATPALLEELDLGTALRVYRDRFSDAGDFTFAIVGNVDTASLRPLVERWLASLPTTGRSETWRDVGARAPAGVVRREVWRGVEPKAETQLVFHGPAAYSMANNYAIAALANVLDVRLRASLREALGGTYGASVRGSLSRLPTPEYQVAISFGSSPDRAEELTAAVLAEIARLRADGPTAAELATVQEMLRRSLETGAEQNGWWVGQLLSYDEQGLPLGDVAQERRWVDALTPAVVRDAARAYLDTGRYVQVRLLPQ